MLPLTKQELAALSPCLLKRQPCPSRCCTLKARWVTHHGGLWFSFFKWYFQMNCSFKLRGREGGKFPNPPRFAKITSVWRFVHKMRRRGIPQNSVVYYSPPSPLAFVWVLLQAKLSWKLNNQLKWHSKINSSKSPWKHNVYSANAAWEVFFHKLEISWVDL